MIAAVHRAAIRQRFAPLRTRQINPDKFEIFPASTPRRHMPKASYGESPG